MRTARTAILLAACVALSSAVVVAQSDTAANLPEVDGAATDMGARARIPARVLFIGNSHTYTNGGIDLHIGRIAQTFDPPLAFSADSVTMSGATLEDHWFLDSQGRIPEGGYDVVVLQGHIPRNANGKASSFLEYARLFDAVAHRYGAETMFFMTGTHPDYPEIHLGDIIEAHRTIADELGAKVAPVAIAARRVARQRPDLELLSSDGVHASWAGTYLAATVVYATLYGRSPVGIDYAFGVSDADAAYLQQVAWATVTDWNAAGDA